MLDPFWTPAHERDVLPRLYRMRHVHNLTMDMSRTSVFSAPAGYRDSVQMLSASELSVAFVWQDAKYISDQNAYLAGAAAQAAKHMSSKAFYFLSVGRNNPNQLLGPSATTEDQVVKDFAVSGYYWKQTDGFYTESVEDDRYKKLSWHRDPLPEDAGTSEGTFVVFLVVTVLNVSLSLSCALCLCTWCLGRRLHGASRSKLPTLDQLMSPLGATGEEGKTEQIIQMRHEKANDEGRC